MSDNQSLLFFNCRMIRLLYLSCNKRRHYRGSTDVSFESGQLQASNTILGKEHQSSSIKGKSRSSNNQLANTNDKQRIQKRSNSRIAGQQNRSTSRLALDQRRTCSFTLKIACSYNNKNWFIYKVSDSSSLCHCNHLPISPKHLVTQKNLLSDEIKNEVESLIESGGTNMVITNHIRIKFNTLLSGSLIQNIRTERITKLIDDNGSDVVFSSSIGRLIGMFQSMPKVSYVYVLHNSASGFVTCSRKETKSTQFEKSLESDVEIWRESIGLNSSADVSVSLAWTTDDEKRKMIMFPEFLGTDMTFGLNKERRNLVTFVGVDGLNQSFIGCRCWMPSKQTISYQWAVDIALPMLIGKSTSMRNRIICSDKEKA